MTKKKKIVCLLGSVLFVLMLLAILYYKKIISINGWFSSSYEVKGIDVSHYQGEIDWEVMEKQEIAFAFIKATEGSKTVDDYFKKNWEEAKDTQILLGAYHFFSFDSDPKTQAENFINTVGSLEKKLPPVVDFEFYGDKEKNPPDIETMRQSLKTFLDLLEQQYGRKPILYTTMKAYHMYIEGEFSEYPLWIRNVYYPANLDMKGKWTFWQYSDHMLLDGYRGDEKYIDMNVFVGNKKELEDFIK